MGIANQQNMIRSIPVLPQPYGIRVRLRPGDPFAKLVGGDWQKTHWFFTAAERDRVLDDMSRKHEYSRIGDNRRWCSRRWRNSASPAASDPLKRSAEKQVVRAVAGSVVARTQIDGT